MRKVTFSAEEELIDRARLVARHPYITLNDTLREWLREFTASSADVKKFDELMIRLVPVNAGRHFTREEMNER